MPKNFPVNSRSLVYLDCLRQVYRQTISLTSGSISAVLFTYSLRLKILLLLVPSIISALIIVGGASLSLARLEEEYLKHRLSVAALVGLQQFEVTLLQGLNSSVGKGEVFSSQAQMLRAGTMQLVKKSQVDLDKAVAKNPSMKVIADEFNELGDRLMALYQQISKVDLLGREKSTRFEVYLVAVSARTLINHGLAAEDSMQVLAREALAKESQTIAVLNAGGILIAALVFTLSLLAFNRLLVSRLKQLPGRIEQFGCGHKLESLVGADEIADLDSSVAAAISALNQLHRQQLAVLQYSGDVLCSLSADGKLLAVNQLSEVFWGYPSRYLIGGRIADILDDGSEELLQNCLAQAKVTDLPCMVELQHCDPSGIDAYFLWIVKWNASTQEYFCISHDITKAKRLERFREDIIASLNHDMRTPLMSISTAFQLLQATRATQMDAQQKSILSRGLAQSMRLIDLITDVLDWKKLESGNLGLAASQVDLLEVTVQALDRVSKEYDEVELEILGAPQFLNGDALQLQKVLEILFHFLLQSSLPGDLFTATLKPSSNGLALSLKLQSADLPLVSQRVSEELPEPLTELISQESIPTLCLPMSFYLVESVLRRHFATLNLQKLGQTYKGANILFGTAPVKAGQSP
ncbi:MAG: histidine kinase dimerization/phospho-acceptor domain-containing protein [Candidatus Melainabacteria bacterium]|nr:histidine kinase dimerization/phospho-acceptor domain-containing protein [Candidatus Melainabacteria bacterium]